MTNWATWGDKCVEKIREGTLACLIIMDVRFVLNIMY